MSDLVLAGNFRLMIVRVGDPTDPGFEGRLAAEVARSPVFSANAPVVLDLKDCPGLASADAFQRLKALFKRQHLIAIGIRHGNATQVRAAMAADLASFPAAGAAESPAPAPSAQPRAAAAAAPGRTRTVTQPVRSGTQIYARGGDLIVLSTVSPGAEVIADGNVHVYGALRGRAIAGASGDQEARIFAGKLEAELVCIAGQYKVSDELPAELRGQPAQVTLAEDRLTVTRL